jgi:hypothetical protein
MSNLDGDFQEQLLQLEKIQTDSAEKRAFVGKLIKLNRHHAELDEALEKPVMLKNLQQCLDAINDDTWRNFESQVNYTLTSLK